MTDTREPRRWGKAGVRLTPAEAARNDARRRSLLYDIAAAEQAAREAWENGRVAPYRITLALNRRQLYGPEVDRACGTAEPAVDEWEAGTRYPTWEQLRALAALTGFPVGFFIRKPNDPLPITFEDTSLRFHLRGPHRPDPPPVLGFTAEAIAHTITGGPCPTCGQLFDKEPDGQDADDPTEQDPTMTDMTTLEQLAARVARHIGAITDDNGAMTCPKCGGDFGPTMTVESLAVYQDGFLPGYPLLFGVCLDCEHHTEPPTDQGDDDTDRP